MVVTSLLRGQTMPTTAEVSMMVRDPKQWRTDYKVGNSYRQSQNSGASSNFQLNGSSYGGATQVWLMGDGTSDAYAKIRNQVYASDQNYTPLNMINMVSHDILNVNINGLT